ncbi:MAG: hypothetical protein DRJ31_07100 [Candidatus Methanomethylicota archaeon]|uniref:Lon proteolytic domain-containing protein n=1 Tax=Thermoproteota archaeon TaxID=2056631 RepID=A0A497EMX9_9CREN|nr:MAG: hypothetical protein DRJ31_07100 [Candidatus Verstraetearchaeota archaeon]
MSQTGRLTYLALLLMILVSSLAMQHALSSQGFERTIVIKAPAVSAADGLRGSLVEISVTAKYPGKGQVYVAVNTLAEVDVQASARMAVLVACKTLGLDPFSYDFYISLTSPTMIVGGPSAGAAMTIAAIACLAGLNVSSNAIMTGMIEPDGAIGPVGGIVAKAEAAAKSGIKLFLIPLGQEITYIEELETIHQGPFVVHKLVKKPVNITEYAWEKWGLKVIEVGDIYEAAQYMLVNDSKPVKLSFEEFKGNLTLPVQATKVFKLGYEEMLRDRDELVGEALKESNMLAGQVKYDVLKLINESDFHAMQASKFYNQSLFYIAASEAFVSAWLAEEALTLAKLTKAKDTASFVKPVLDNVNTTLQLVRQKLSNYEPRTLSDLDCLTICYERLSMASSALEEAVKALSEGDLAKVAYNLAYAKWRVKTAELWSKALGLGSVELPSKDRLMSIANALLREAQSVLSYARALTKESFEQMSLFKSASEDLREAERAYSHGIVYAAISKSILAMAKASTTLNQIFVASEESLSHQLSYSRKLAESLIGSLISEGVIPIIPLSYYEYATYRLENLFDKLLHYRLASGHASALLLASGIAKKASIEEASQSIWAQAIPSKQALPLLMTLTAIMLVTIGFLTGFFIGKAAKSRREYREALSS